MCFPACGPVVGSKVVDIVPDGTRTWRVQCGGRGGVFRVRGQYFEKNMYGSTEGRFVCSLPCLLFCTRTYLVICGLEH